MNITITIQADSKKKSYRNGKGKRLKSQRANINEYEKLIEKAEKLGIENITFDKDFPFSQRNKILKNIIRDVKEMRK